MVLLNAIVLDMVRMWAFQKQNLVNFVLITKPLLVLVTLHVTSLVFFLALFLAFIKLAVSKEAL